MSEVTCLSGRKKNTKQKQNKVWERLRYNDRVHLLDVAVCSFLPDPVDDFEAQGAQVLSDLVLVLLGPAGGLPVVKLAVEPSPSEGERGTGQRQPRLDVCFRQRGSSLPETGTFLGRGPSLSTS